MIGINIVWHGKNNVETDIIFEKQQDESGK